MNLKDLQKEMPYEYRTWPWGTQLAYITARQAQDRLDEVCWPENWKVEYKEIKWELFAWVSIKVWDEWITKWDWGTESNIEKEKWLISDSFKRACVTWGIGRFLYTLWTKKKEEDLEKHTCQKCWEVVNVKPFQGKFGMCFKCPECNQFSKPAPVYDWEDLSVKPDWDNK